MLLLAEHVSVISVNLVDLQDDSKIVQIVVSKTLTGVDAGAVCSEKASLQTVFLLATFPIVVPIVSSELEPVVRLDPNLVLVEDENGCINDARTDINQALLAGKPELLVSVLYRSVVTVLIATALTFVGGTTLQGSLLITVLLNN